MNWLKYQDLKKSSKVILEKSNEDNIYNINQKRFDPDTGSVLEDRIYTYNIRNLIDEQKRYLKESEDSKKKYDAITAVIDDINNL